MLTENPVSAAKAGGRVTSEKVNAKINKIDSVEELARYVNVRNVKLSKLVPGQKYWVIIERWIKDSCQKVWTKIEYKGETGYNNCLLSFERELRDYTNEPIRYYVTYPKNDFIFGHLQVLTDEEYREHKSFETWEQIRQTLKSNGIDMNNI